MSVAAVGAVLYALFLLFYAVWGFFILYHLFRFAPHRHVAVAGAILFITVTIFLLLVTAAYLGPMSGAWPGSVPGV